MSYSLKLAPTALKDLQEAKKWYNQKRENLGEEFKQVVNREIDYIKVNPKHYQRKYKELRQSVIIRFPYTIFYLIEESKHQIIILGVLHSSRSPEVVKSRIK